MILKYLNSPHNDICLRKFSIWAEQYQKKCKVKKMFLHAKLHPVHLKKKNYISPMFKHDGCKSVQFLYEGIRKIARLMQLIQYSVYKDLPQQHFHYGKYSGHL